MPKSKEYLTSSSEAESSEEEKPKKKQKREQKEDPEKKPSKKPKTDSKEEEETTTWDLGSNRQVNVREFKGKTYVDIREMYMDQSGDFKPGKKGIMLNMVQWRKLVGMIEDVDKVVKSKC